VPGTYLLVAQVTAEVQFSAGSLGFIEAELYDGNLAAQVPGSYAVVALSSQVNVPAYSTVSVAVLYTVAAATMVTLMVSRNSAGTWTISSVYSDADGQTALSWVRVA
jgi:hypothetical protein